MSLPKLLRAINSGLFVVLWADYADIKRCFSDIILTR
jgi:hypothetical protein